MATFSFDNLKDCQKAIRGHMRDRRGRLRKAVRQAAIKGRNYIARSTVPRAHEELADSIRVEHRGYGKSDIIADAPHAAAVENGSRPHWVPLDALIAWVQLRGLQGLTATGRVTRTRRQDVLSASEQGTTDASRRIANAIRGKTGGRKGAMAWRARAALGSLAHQELGVDPATRAIARAIQMVIAKRGTRPRKYMMRGVDPTTRYLDEFVRAALPDP